MLFTFPSRYLFTIDLKKYLALGHSRPGFLRDFTGPAVLKICRSRVITPFALQGCHLLWQSFPALSAREVIIYVSTLLCLGRKRNYLATLCRYMDLDPSDPDSILNYKFFIKDTRIQNIIKIQGHKTQDTNKFQIPIIKQFEILNLYLVSCLYPCILYPCIF